VFPSLLALCPAMSSRSPTNFRGLSRSVRHRHSAPGRAPPRCARACRQQPPSWSVRRAGRRVHICRRRIAPSQPSGSSAVDSAGRDTRGGASPAPSLDSSSRSTCMLSAPVRLHSRPSLAWRPLQLASPAGATNACTSDDPRHQARRQRRRGVVASGLTRPKLEGDAAGRIGKRGSRGRQADRDTVAVSHPTPSDSDRCTSARGRSVGVRPAGSSCGALATEFAAYLAQVPAHATTGVGQTSGHSSGRPPRSRPSDPATRGRRNRTERQEVGRRSEWRTTETAMRFGHSVERNRQGI
jgi:hypothetical protein